MEVLLPLVILKSVEIGPQFLGNRRRFGWLLMMSGWSLDRGVFAESNVQQTLGVFPWKPHWCSRMSLMTMRGLGIGVFSSNSSKYGHLRISMHWLPLGGLHWESETENDIQKLDLLRLM